MRIGLISYEYPPQQGMGGVGTYMFRLAGALGKAGHEVHVITGPSDRAPVPQPNVTLHRIEAEFEPESSRVTRWLYWHAIAEPMGKCNPIIWHWLRWNLASYEAIRRIDAQHPFDVVEAPEHAANGWMAGRIHRWPIVIRMHCPWELFVRINRVPFNPMDRLMSMLERRTVDLAASKLRLRHRIVKRKTAEEELRQSGEHQARLLQESLLMQQRLSRLTRRLLVGQESERKKISLGLRDEIAQTLLGINVRLLALKADAAINTVGFHKEIGSTQQLVAKSAKALHRVARGFGQEAATRRVLPRRAREA
jgi:glycosyltransferase involved in cell wall biosynthesis